jgi:hypothetical protein
MTSEIINFNVLYNPLRHALYYEYVSVNFKVLEAIKSTHFQLAAFYGSQGSDFAFIIVTCRPSTDNCLQNVVMQMPRAQ